MDEKWFERTLLFLGIIGLGVLLFAGVANAAGTVCQIANGCTGLGTSPAYGQVLLGNNSGGYTLTATSSLGISGGGSSASSTLLSDNNTFSGVDSFTSSSANFSGTWQTFSPSHFQTALTLPLSVSNGGTGLTSTSQNFFFAGPTSGTGAPTWRAIVAGDIPTLNQNTTGSAATLTTARTINGVSFNGSANIVVASTTLLGTDNNTFSGNTVFSASTTIGAKLNLQNATSTGFEVTTNNVYLDGYTSALLEANGSHQITAYGGASCSSQFVLSFSAIGGATCGSVNNSFWSGTALSIANGGTGQATQQTALNALAPTPTRAGDIIYYNGSNWTNLAGNNLGTQVLQETSTGVPSWAAAGGTGTVTSVGMTVPSFLSVSPSSITTSGTFAVSLSGTALPIANGGSNATSFTTSGNSVYYNGTSLVTAGAAAAVTTPNASTTNETISSYLSTGANSLVGIASTTPSALQGLDIATTTVISNAGIANSIASTTADLASQLVSWDTGDTQRYDLAQNTTFIINATSSLPKDGGKYILKVCELTAGAYTVSFTQTPNVLRWANGTTTFSTTQNTCSLIGMIYDQNQGIYDVVASSTGIQSY